MCSVRALWSEDHDQSVSATATFSVTEILFHAILTRVRPQLLRESDVSRVYAELYVITFISSCIDNTLLGNELIYLIRVFLHSFRHAFRTDKKDFIGNVRLI